MIKKRFVVVDCRHGDSIFNECNQTCFFPTLKAAQKGIKTQLDEPVGEDGEGKILTYRDEGKSEKNYLIFERVKS